MIELHYESLRALDEIPHPVHFHCPNCDHVLVQCMSHLTWASIECDHCGVVVKISSYGKHLSRQYSFSYDKHVTGSIAYEDGESE